MLRDFACDLFDHGVPEEAQGDTKYVRSNIFVRYPLLREVLWQPAVMDVCESLFPEGWVMLSAPTLCDARYSGWHKDTHGIEKLGLDFHNRPGFLATTVILYLQDNSPQLGGGIDVIPGSHLEAFRYDQGGSARGEGRAKLGELAYPGSRVHSIPSRAGDLIVFDIRLDHKATWPTLLGESENLYAAARPEDPRVPRKFLITWKAMAEGPYVADYQDYFRKMAELEPSMKYDPRLPDPVREQALRRNLRFVER